MAGAIFSIVLWGVLREIIAVAIVFAGLLLGGFISYVTDREWPALVGLVVGWIAAIIWEIFVITWIITGIIAVATGHY